MTAVFFALVLFADLLAVVCQPYCPPIARFADAAVMVFPVILAYGALALPFPAALLLAFCNGLLWDALTCQILNKGANLNDAVVVESPIGWSIVLFGALTVLVHGLRPLFLRGRWDLHCLASGFCTVVILGAEFLMITFKRGGLIFPPDLGMRLLLPGFFAMVLSPFVYLGFGALAAVIGYPVRIYDEKPRL